MSARARRDLVAIVVVLAIMALANVVPTDTSLRLVQERGSLRLCIPESYPPLVTDGPATPGVDVEIMQAVADNLGLRLQTITNRAIGRDFNPRNWRITRAQCEVIGGGVVTTGVTESFLETTPSHLETGWAIAVPTDLDSLTSARVGFLSGASGLDRIRLSRFLREIAVETTILQSYDEALRAIEGGEVDAIATEALRARQLAGETGWEAQYLPESLGRYPLGFGLWKGDLTLKRALVAELQALLRTGAIEEIVDAYDLTPITPTCDVCPSTDAVP
ncbi:MAG: transporter substrate-binding domain-containing protein [Trueperaceae bacterium]|nr:transporter substrate-binding domain-containing protein [Trueperaceae bacterium]